MRTTTTCAAIGVTAALVLGGATGPVDAASLGTKVLRGAAIGFAVKQFSKPLNDFINTVTLRHNVPTRLATKVVPILSVGEKGYVGGAQVAGPEAAVDEVHAVFQYEQNISTNNYRAKVLVPSASLNPLQLKRVPKVGVTALIDVALGGGLRNETVGTGIQTGDIIRGGAVLVAVKAAGPAINKALNTITLNKGTATRVVPMASFGEKVYLGGAQVSASSSVISSVKAVWQYEDLFADGRFRVKVVVPTTALNPLQMKRAEGAGVTAVVDMALSQQRREEDVRRERERRWPFGFGRPRWGRRDDDRRSERRREEDEEDDRDERYRGDRGRHEGWLRGQHKGWLKPTPKERDQERARRDD